MTTTALKPPRMALAEARKYLGYTEGMEQRLFRMSQDGNVGFVLDTEKLASQGIGYEGLPAAPHPFVTFHVGSGEYRISNEGLTDAFKKADLPARLVDDVPLEVTEPLLNWKFRNKGKEFKALIRDGIVTTFCLPGTEIYSTTKLLDSILEHMVEENASIINFYHDINETTFTVLDDTVSTRLPDGSVLIGGVHLHTSLIGLKPLLLQGFVLRTLERSTGGEPELFEGGSLSTAIKAYKWDRTRDQKRLMAEPEEAEKMGTAYDFVKASAGALLREVNDEFERVAHLAEHTLDQRVGPYLDDIIKRYKIPDNRYQPVMQEYAHSESSRSVLDLWMGFGHVGFTDDTLDPRLQTMMYRTAGEIARNPAMCSTCHRSMLQLQ